MSESPRCEGCGNEIDPDTCGCGSAINHSPCEDHQPIPMGCDRGRDKEWNGIFEKGAILP